MALRVTREEMDAADAPEKVTASSSVLASMLAMAIPSGTDSPVLSISVVSASRNVAGSRFVIVEAASEASAAVSSETV
jgi:hypothetical protein